MTRYLPLLFLSACSGAPFSLNEAQTRPSPVSVPLSSDDAGQVSPSTLDDAGNDSGSPKGSDSGSPVAVQDSGAPEDADQDSAVVVPEPDGGAEAGLDGGWAEASCSAPVDPTATPTIACWASFALNACPPCTTNAWQCATSGTPGLPIFVGDAGDELVQVPALSKADVPTLCTNSSACIWTNVEGTSTTPTAAGVWCPPRDVVHTATGNTWDQNPADYSGLPAGYTCQGQGTTNFGPGVFWCWIADAGP